jgi:signal transduction histidine kinase
VIISASKVGQNVELTYDDQGKKFQGNSGRLGELFYKFNSTKGTGVGLYLIKNLMRKMDGSFEIINTDRLKLKLTFKSPEGGSDV